MGFYSDRILPHCIDKGCAAKPISRQRQKVVPQAEGRILEVGMGSGLNIPFYTVENVELVWGLEPSAGMREKARARVDAAPFELRWLDLPGEEIPLDDDSADTVVLTYTLCTIPGWKVALEQMRRVLKPGGKLLFSEHGDLDEGHRRLPLEPRHPPPACTRRLQHRPARDDVPALDAQDRRIHVLGIRRLT